MASCATECCRLETLLLVPLTGIEPALLAELDFEQASTNLATGAFGSHDRWVEKPTEYSVRQQHWPGVQNALRAIARKIHATRQANRAAGSAPIDPEWEEVQQLKSVAMPLLFQLREDQKREVRSLAHIIGLGSVASLI
jgi:hypothetical protein